MIPARFDYQRAESVDHAIELLGSREEERRSLAGGHSLLPMMKLRFARPATLVDIGPLTELSYVRDTGDTALDRRVDPAPRRAPRPARARALRSCPYRGRARGRPPGPPPRHDRRVGVARRSGGRPAAIMLALDAELVVKGPSGEWTLPADGFFQGYYQCALGEQDVLTEIRIPKADGAYVKFHRRAQDWATVGVAVARSNGSGPCGPDEHGPDSGPGGGRRGGARLRVVSGRCCRAGR